MNHAQLVLLLSLCACNSIVGNDGQSTDRRSTAEQPPPPPGPPIYKTVSAGDVGRSKNYRMVFTLGQESPMQGGPQSSNYNLRGGLVCTDGR